MSIYLLRHGQTDWNLIGRCQGHTDIPLNETGRKMVKDAADLFEIDIGKLDYIIASPLSRAQESARIFADTIGYEKEIIIEELFRERCFGVSEGMLNSDILSEFPDLIIPEMEPEEELLKRVMNGLNHYSDMYFDLDILIVTHGAVLKKLVENQSSYEKKDKNLVHAVPGQLFKMELKNGEINICIQG